MVLVDEPTSPMSPKEIDDESTSLMLQQFLDDWHFRFVHSSLGKAWHRSDVVDAALEILCLNGVSLDAELRASLVGLEDEALLEVLVPRVPQAVRQNLENTTMQLQVVVSMVSRIRHGLDERRISEVGQALEESDGAGIGQQIMKQIIVAAARDIGHLKHLRKSWTENTLKRVERLQKSALLAEDTQRHLIAIEAQLSSFGSEQNAKNKKVLMGLADKKDDTLKKTVLSAWLGFHMKWKQEQSIRAKYEKMATDAEDMLIQWQEKKILNIRNVLMRKCAESDAALIDLCFETWWEAVEEAKKEGGTKAEMERLEAALSKNRATSRDATLSVMNKMAAQGEDALKALAFRHFVKFHEDYQKEKELEDQVKATEKALAEHMAKKKDEAKGVLDRMAGASGAGLLMQCVQGWATYIKEEKKEKEMAALLNGNADRFKSLQARQSGCAMGAQTRVNDQRRANLFLRVIGAWVVETKVNRIEKYYQGKIENKRKQLGSCQTLFKSFARQLEAGLSQITEEDETMRSSRSHKRSHRGVRGDGEGMSRSDPNTQSLPDIHSRPVVA